MARVFLDLPKIRLDMAWIGNEGGAYQLQCAMVVVQTLPLQSGPSGSPTLGRAVASSSHCQSVLPKGAQGQKPTHSEPSHRALEAKASPSRTIKHDQKRSNHDHRKSDPNGGPSKAMKTIKQVLSPTMAHSQGHRQPPHCSSRGRPLA